MNPMRICLISNLYGEHARGGAERVVEAEAAALAVAGNAVTVISAKPPARPPKGVCDPDDPFGCADKDGALPATKEKTVRTWRFRSPNLYFYPDGDRFPLAVRFFWHAIDLVNVVSAARVGKVLAGVRPDVVHTHNLMGLGFVVPSVIRKRGIPHVHTVHDVQLLHPSGLLPPDDGAVPWYRRAPRAAYRALTRRLMGDPDVVIFPSERLRELHVARGFFRRSRIEVVRNPGPEPRTEPRTAPTALRFLFAGQLEPHKGVSMLLDAWRSWEDRGAAELSFAGSGTLEREVKAAEEAGIGVRSLGRLDRAALLERMAASTYLVFPSIVMENAPVVIAESMSQGTPVIAARTGGVPEIVEEGKNGFLFRPGDVQDCVAALRRAAAAVPEWAAFFEGAMRSAYKASPSDHAERLVDLYSTTVKIRSAA